MIGFGCSFSRSGEKDRIQRMDGLIFNYQQFHKDMVNIFVHDGWKLEFEEGGQGSQGGWAKVPSSALFLLFWQPPLITNTQTDRSHRPQQAVQCSGAAENSRNAA